MGTNCSNTRQTVKITYVAVYLDVYSQCTALLITKSSVVILMEHRSQQGNRYPLCRSFQHRSCWNVPYKRTRWVANTSLDLHSHRTELESDDFYTLRQQAAGRHYTTNILECHRSSDSDHASANSMESIPAPAIEG